MNFSTKALVTVLFALALLSVAVARAQDQHHESDSATAAPSTGTSAEQPAATPFPQTMMPMMNMMSMMGQQPQGMPMMGMMGQGGMGMMGMGGSGATGMPGMVDHIEGRIAFLRAELAITDAQAPSWSEFAEALRVDAKRHNDARGVMMQQGAATSLAMRLDQQEKALGARLDGVRALKAALRKLSAVLDETQKRTLEELAPMQFGPMMTMMM